MHIAVYDRSSVTKNSLRKLSGKYCLKHDFRNLFTEIGHMDEDQCTPNAQKYISDAQFLQRVLVGVHWSSSIRPTIKFCGFRSLVFIP